MTKLFTLSNLICAYLFITIPIASFGNEQAIKKDSPPQPTLTILNWEDYLSEDLLNTWQKKTGYKVKQVYFDNDEERDVFLASNSALSIDIVVMDEPGGNIFGNRGTFVPRSKYPKIPALSGIEGFWNDRCGPYSVPYLWGTFGLVYRKDKLAKAPDSWWDLLRPAPSLKKRMSIMSDTIDTFAPSLLSRGKSINTKRQDELQVAFEDTRAIVPYLLTFEYPITYVGADEPFGELHMGTAYSGDQHVMNEASQSDNWQYVVPKEGTILWVDCFAVLEKSNNKNMAFDFITFMSTAENAAENSMSLQVATTSLSAKKLQPKAFQENKSIYPDEITIEKSQYYVINGEKNFQLRNRMTSSLMKLHESQ